MKKILLVIILLFTSTKAYALSVPSNNAILMDQESGRVLYSKNINEVRSVASISKIMTAIIAIESGKLDDRVTITEDMIKTHGSSIYLSVGEVMSVRNLVYGLLLRSGNDASLALADYLYGREEFVKKMNEKAKEIGMKNTIFNNPNGLDDEGEKGNYSTCYDMALLMRYANNLFDFREIDSTKYIMVQTNLKTYTWYNKNKLLNTYRYANGGKTGYTGKAKRTLVTSASNENANLIVVTFVDSDAFNTHKRLYEYGFTNYRNYLIINKNNIKIKSNKYKNLYVKNNYYYLMSNNERNNINTNVKLYKNKRKNNCVGYIEVFYKNKSVHKEYIYAK